MQPKKLYLGLAVLLVVVGAGAFALARSGSHKASTMDSMSTQSAVATNKITIQNYMFGPMAIKVPVDSTVTWTNHDQVSHTVTADTPSSAAPSSMDIAPGKSYSFRFTKAGTYTYHCFPHPYMHGTVEVTNG